MEVIGIIREIDNLGRICIPKEIRKTLKLAVFSIYLRKIIIARD